MKPIIKINFTDFWEPFDKSNNFFYDILSQKYTIQISSNPDFLFYSCYGNEHLKYNCIKIFYTSENKRPDFLLCDYAISFDYLNKRNHFRLPLYHLYIDKHHYYDRLSTSISDETARRIWKQKTKFCCMLVSNPNSKERIDFFHALSKVKKVDSAGRYLNNIGGEVEDKMDFIKDYKFVFAFENSSYPGYTTEKILEPLVANCIPIYWGNPLIENDFKGGCFLNAHKFDGYDPLIKKIIEIDANTDLAVEMLTQKKFSSLSRGHLQAMDDIKSFLTAIIENKKKLPVAKRKAIRILRFERNILKKVISKILFITHSGLNK